MIKRQGKSHVLRAESDEDCQSWIELIQQCIADVNEQDCQSSEDEEDVASPNPAVDAISDKACKYNIMKYLLVLTHPLHVTINK